MPTPSPTSYSAPSSPVAAGRFIWPAWRRGKAAMSVFEIPTANTLEDINPRYNPLVNPNYPNIPDWFGNFDSIIDAWCGGCFGDEVSELWLPLNGGHANYAGNEPYRLRLAADVPAFDMVRPPTGAIGNLVSTRDGQDATGVYADGRPRAIHSYNKPQWAPGIGPVITIQGNCAWGGQNGTKDMLWIDRNTGECTRGVACPTTSGTSGMGACYDSLRHGFWARTVGTGRFRFFDIALNEWTTVLPLHSGSGLNGIVHIPTLDLLLWFNDDSPPTHRQIVNPTTGARTNLALSSEPLGCHMGGRLQPVWVPELNAVAVWDNATNTNVVNLIHPPANPLTDVWPVTQLTFDPVDMPTARCFRGTYGRFFYSSKLGGFGVLNSVYDRPYFFAIR